MVAPVLQMPARRMLRLAALGAVQRNQTAMGLLTLDSPGDWNTPPEKLPAVLLRSGDERKISLIKGQAEFLTSVSLELEGRIEATSETAAQDAIELLYYNLENILLGDENILNMIEQVASVDVRFEITAEGRRHLAGFKAIRRNC